MLQECNYCNIFPVDVALLHCTCSAVEPRVCTTRELRRQRLGRLRTREVLCMEYHVCTSIHIHVFRVGLYLRVRLHSNWLILGVTLFLLKSGLLLLRDGPVGCAESYLPRLYWLLVGAWLEDGGRGPSGLHIAIFV